MTEKTQFLGYVLMFPGSAETLVRRGGITNHLLIAYTLSNISAKNYQNRLICLEAIVCYISVVFETQRIDAHIPGSTLDALLNLLLSMTPTCRNEGSFIQQVLMAQLPDIPWHLHS